MDIPRTVWHRETDNVISFQYLGKDSCPIGETTESLESFRDWMVSDWRSRNVQFTESDIPGIT